MFEKYGKTKAVYDSRYVRDMITAYRPPFSPAWEKHS